MEVSVSQPPIRRGGEMPARGVFADAVSAAYPAGRPGSRLGVVPLRLSAAYPAGRAGSAGRCCPGSSISRLSGGEVRECRYRACRCISQPPIRRGGICGRSACSRCLSQPPIRRGGFWSTRSMRPAFSQPPIRRGGSDLRYHLIPLISQPPIRRGGRISSRDRPRSSLSRLSGGEVMRTERITWVGSLSRLSGGEVRAPGSGLRQ